MKKILILISGMPATGKSTFAIWLSKRLNTPMISYDSIKEKIMELVTQSNIPQEQMQLFHEFPYELFWFACKEAMNCDGIVIADYIFTTKMNERLDSLTKSLGYQTLQIHFDAEIEIAYQRFLERNKDANKEYNIRPINISLDTFKNITEQNKKFRYGSNYIVVDTTDYAKISYEEIYHQINLFCQMNSHLSK